MHPSPIAQASNPHTKPQARKPGSLLKGFANGGTIEGPGTPTSDSIPAKVKQTGEPIQVANGERIVSADQDALLLRIAKAMGHKSVDEMFQAGTGKPVGPTVKYSKGKAIKGAAGGSSPEELERQALVNQIPTGGTGTGPTPQPDPSQSASSTELGRNVGNAFNALAPLAGGPTLLNGASRLGMALGASPAVGSAISTAMTAIPKAMPYAVPAIAAGSLGIASSPQAQTSTAPAAPEPYPEKQSTRNPPDAQPVTTPPTSPILGNIEGVSVGNGITRFDMAGKQTSSVGPPLPVPLFTNRTDAAGMADNAALTNRSPMTTQNQGAMDGIQSRQDARMSAMVSKAQYDKEVAGAQAVNDAGERLNLEYALKNGKPQERKAAQAILENMDATAKDLRGNAITTRGQDITANASAQSNKLAQNKDGREAAYSAMDQKAKQQLMDAQQEYLNAKTPEEQKAAERKLMTLGNKQGKAPTFHPGSRIKNVDGSETVTPAYVFDPTTGEAREVQPGKSGVPDAATARTQALAALKANPANKAEINKRLAAAGYQPI